MWPTVIGILLLIASSIATTDKTIDLSGKGLKKEEFFMNIQKKIRLQEVTELILQRNEFDSFLDCSTNLGSLRKLDLSQNHLQRFFFLCKDEYNLQILNVSHNKLEYIDDNAFNGRIPKLQILDLSWNKLSVVNETMLEHFKVLEYLSLASNPINDGIHENAFWNLKALKHLDLSNVSSTYFKAEFFQTLTNLSVLDLSKNPITVVPILPTSLEELDLSNTHVTRLQGLFLPRLRELRLNYMHKLRELTFNDLEHLINLETLSLSGSKKLVDLKMNPYNDRLLPHLQRLFINDCSLKTLDYKLMSIIKKPTVLKLENNPWNCDCQMQWIILSNSTNAISQEIRCRIPEQYNGTLLSNIPAEELTCDNESSLFRPILWACILLLIVALTLSIGFFLMRRPLGRWDIRRKNRDTVTYKNVDESSNDMVRILTVNDAIDRNDD